MPATSNFHRKVASVRPLLGTILLGLALVACGSPSSSAVDAKQPIAGVAASGSGVSVDVLTTNTWQGGFNGAVRITDSTFASPISSFTVVFKMATGSVAGTPWNGTITGPDASGNFTATNPSWLTNQPIQKGQTWDVGFNGSGTFTTSSIVSLTINGAAVSLGTTTTDAPPTVSLASSAATVTTASTITLTATAADDKGVSKVEFYDGATLLGSKTAAPYTQTAALTSANNGTHSYTAKAYDTASQVTTSTAVSVTVNIAAADLPPTVSLASSASTVTAASTITLTATASDDKGVNKVEFYDGTTLVGTDTTAPYSQAVALTSANNGTHTYTAKAYDTANQVTTSASVAVTVNIGAADLPPTVSIASSATSVTAASTITLTATASDDKGVNKVEFYDGTTLLGTDTTAPYTQAVSLSSANNGTHTYTARAYDTANQVTASTAVAVSVNIGVTDLPPTVSLASSATNVTAVSSITLTATATDDKGVNKVEFYEGTTLLGTDTTSPYTQAVSFTSANNGTHTYTAKAYDTISQTTTSSAVTVTVNIGVTDLPPTVTLVSSASTVTAAGTITLTATATDDKGVSKVEFYEGTTLLGSVTASPITQTVAYTSANNGTHTYTAKAYDTANQSTTSSPVSVSVNIGGTTPSYAVDPPDVCYNQYWVKGCETGTCGGRCQVANACSPPEDPSKSALPKTFACPRFMMYSDEMAAAAKDDWGANPPFVYGVVGHDADAGGLDVGSSSCCQCYQLVFEKPEGGSPQPPDLPIPKPMIVQSFNTAAGGGKNFDIYMGAGGFGAFNACVPGSYSGTATTTFGSFQYSAFPSDYPTMGGVKALNIPECKVNGGVTAASMQSAACQNKIAQLCNNTTAASSTVTNETKNSCIQSNAFANFYHQNWQVRAKRVECPVSLTRVTGCRLQSQGLPAASPTATTPATADSSFRTGYTTTTMQDCCKPSCAWQDQVSGAGLKVVDKWTSFYSCDQNGAPITAP
jgi:hypothetical protein